MVQVLTVGTANGLLVTYLASLPSVLAAAGTKHAALTSLGEMTVHDVSAHSSTLVRVDCEPSFCSLGPRHLAVGVNNQVMFYAYDTTPGQLVNTRSYLGGVHAVCLNDTHAAVLTDGRVLVHTIEDADKGAGADMCLSHPGAVRPEPITCMALSHHFLVTATGSGSVCYHMVQDGTLATVNEYRHMGKTAG
jgi:WD repeat-containing protein 19